MNIVKVVFVAYTSENGMCEHETQEIVTRDLTGMDLMYQAVIQVIRNWNRDNRYQISDKDIIAVEIVAN